MTKKIITNRDIIHALKVIQAVCKELDCGICPLGNGETCAMEKSVPVAWKIDEEGKAWRALK